MLVATTNDLPGYRITAHIGMGREVTVRSRLTEAPAYGAAVKIDRL